MTQTSENKGRTRGHDSAEAIEWIRHVLRKRPDAQLSDFASSAGVNRKTIANLLGSSPRRSLYTPTYQRIMATGPDDIRLPSNRLIDGTVARNIVGTLTGMGWTLREIAEKAGLSPKTIIKDNMEAVQTETLERLLHARRTLLETTPNGPGEQYVPSFPMLRRVDALMAMGWDRKEIAQRAGVTPEIIRTTKKRVAKQTATAVAAAYERMRFSLGGNDITRRRAKRLGYAPWSAWPNGTIDVANAVPDWGFVDDEEWREAIRERYQERLLA